MYFSGAPRKWSLLKVLMTSFIKTLSGGKYSNIILMVPKQVLLWTLKTHFKISSCKQSNIHLWNSFLLNIVLYSGRVPSSDCSQNANHTRLASWPLLLCLKKYMHISEHFKSCWCLSAYRKRLGRQRQLFLVNWEPKSSLTSMALRGTEWLQGTVKLSGW